MVERFAPKTKMLKKHPLIRGGVATTRKKQPSNKVAVSLGVFARTGHKKEDPQLHSQRDSFIALNPKHQSAAVATVLQAIKD